MSIGLNGLIVFKFLHLLIFFEREDIKFSSIKILEYLFSILFLSFFLCIFLDSVVKFIHIWDCYTFSMNLSIYKNMFLFIICNILCLIPYFFLILIQLLQILSFVLHIIYFQLLIFNPFMSLYLKIIFCNQHKILLTSKCSVFKMFILKYKFTGQRILH